MKRAWRRRTVSIGTSALMICSVALQAPAVADAADGGHDGEREAMAEFLWDEDPTIRGMITLSYASAKDDDGPTTRGLRLGYGYLGGKHDDYPWGEFWVTFREHGDDEAMAAGLSVVPIARLSRRLGLGPLFDLGLSRRREGGRSVYAGLIGTGAEGVVRWGRRWDLVTTAEAAYRTTGDVEFQVRVGVRFHHRRMPFVPRHR